MTEPDDLGDPDPNDPAWQRVAVHASADVLELVATTAAAPGNIEALEEAYHRVLGEEHDEDRAFLLLGAAVGMLGEIVRHLECSHQSVGDVVTKVRARAAELRSQA